MVSINSSATLAIRNLQSISKSLAETQDRMTTGFKIRSAKDDATVWQAATTIRSEIKTSDAMSKDLESIKTAADIATAGVDALTSSLSEIKSKVTAYGLEGDTNKKAIIAADIAALQKQMISTLATAEYNGANWLDGSATAVNYGGTFKANGDPESVAFSLTDLKTALSNTGIHDDATNANDIASFFTTFDIATDSVIPSFSTNFTTSIDTQVKALKTYSAKLSSLSGRITSQQDLLQKISDIKETALGSLVNADLEEEAAKASALQVKQQLAYQAISMVNASTTNILRLFQ